MIFTLVTTGSVGAGVVFVVGYPAGGGAIFRLLSILTSYPLRATFTRLALKTKCIWWLQRGLSCGRNVRKNLLGRARCKVCSEISYLGAPQVGHVMQLR